MEIQAALAAVQRQLSPLQFAAQSSTIYLNRFQTLYEALGGTTTTLVALPAATPTVGPNQVDRELYTTYIQVSSGMLSDIQQLVLVLENAAVGDTMASQLVRDIEFFQSQATAVHQSLSVGEDKQQLRHELLRLRALSQGITQMMQQAGRVGRVAQRWQLIVEELAELGELVGISAGPTIDPGQPIMLNLPTYHHMPYQVQRPTPAQLSNEAIPIADQAIAHVDAFVTGFNRFLHLSPRVPALQAQARQLRVMLGQVRQEIANGATPQQITSRLDQIDQTLRSCQQPVGAHRAGATVVQHT